MSWMNASTSALLVAAAGVLAPATRAQIVNDECSGAVVVIDGVNGPYSTVGSTTSSPAWPCAAGGNDIWFVYQSSCTGTVTVETCGIASYDTAIQLFDPTCSPCPNFTTGPCNDDSCSSLQSRITITAQQGGLVYIRVGGFASATGGFSLNVACSGGGPGAPDDECSGATAIGVGLNAGISTVGYTTSFSWPCAAGGTDRWFSFVPTCRGQYTFDTCTPNRGYDTALEIFQGPCSPCGMTSLACNDDFCGLGSSITLQLGGGIQYLIRLGGFAALSGTTDLVVTLAGSGSFSTAFAGCGGNTMVATGSPNIGGAVNYTMGPVQGVAQCWIGLAQLNIPLCAANCVLGCTIQTPIAGNVIAGPVPCDPTLVGAQFYVQGIDLGAPGGCTLTDPLGIPFTTSDTVLTTIGA